jgi:hypothetical protein
MPTEILRPNGNGDTIQLDVVPTFGTDNWDRVDEASADDASTYVYTNNTSFREDRYTLQATGLTTETIDSIDAVHRGRASASNTVEMEWGVRLGSSNSMGSTVSTSSTTWTTRTNSGLGRPGGGSWAVADLNSLRYRHRMRRVSGTVQAQCTQVFVRVNYSLPPAPTELAGRSATGSRAGLSLATGVSLAGRSATGSRAAGDISIATPISGRSDSGSRTDVGLDASVALDARTATSSRAAVAIAAVVAMAGRSATPGRGDAVLDTAVAIAGASRTVARAGAATSTVAFVAGRAATASRSVLLVDVTIAAGGRTGTASRGDAALDIHEPSVEPGYARAADVGVFGASLSLAAASARAADVALGSAVHSATAPVTAVRDGPAGGHAAVSDRHP